MSLSQRFSTTMTNVDEDNLPFTEMVLKFAEKVYTEFLNSFVLSKFQCMYTTDCLIGNSFG